MAYTSAVASLERATTSTSLIDVLDRVLDKGIVIDAWLRVSLVGIDLITVEARVLVASIHTYLQYADAVAELAPSSRPVRRATGLDPQQIGKTTTVRES
jgi:hypothetical protein